MKRSPLKRRRAKPRRSKRMRDVEHLLLVKQLPCCRPVVCRGGELRKQQTDEWERCEGPIEADHAGRRPLGRKCSDDETIPLCRRHHRDRTDLRGVFAGFDAWCMRQWLDRQIALTRAAVQRLRERDDFDGTLAW